MPRTLLLADDSLTIRKVVELTFGDTDNRVESVGTGSEAIDRFAAVRPDVVLADVVMPGPSGYAVCRAVKSSDHPVPVLLLAGTFEAFDPEEARACGADGHLTKPFDSRTLVEWVGNLLAPKPVLVEEPVEDPVVDTVEEPVDEPAEEPVVASPAEPAPTADADIEAIFEDLAAPGSVAALDAAPGPPAAAPETAWEPAPGAPDPAASSRPAIALSPAEIDAIARAVVERLSDRILREIAWDVVPDLAEVIVRERLRELEREP